MKPNDVSLEVGIRAIILNLENVEDAAQTFQAKVYFELVWKALPGDWEKWESLLKSANITNEFLEAVSCDPLGTIYDDSDADDLNLTLETKFRERILRSFTMTEDFVPHWEPGVILSNLIQTVEYDEFAWGSGKFCCVELKGERYVVKRTQFTGVFAEGFELENFPVDHQKLSVKFMCISPTIQARLVPHPTFREANCGVILKAHSTLQDWRYKGKFLEFNTDEQGRFSTFTVNPVFSRKPQPWIWNICFVVCVLSSTYFCMYSIGPEDVGDRLAHIGTMLLANVAFRFITSEKLPQLPYLTIIDKYTLFHFVLGVAIAVSLMLYPLIDDVALFDHIFGFLFGALFILYNLYFYFDIEFRVSAAENARYDLSAESDLFKHDKEWTGKKHKSFHALPENTMTEGGDKREPVKKHDSTTE